MIAYRIQDQSRSLDALTDPEQQYSFPMDGDDEAVRHGVSGMDSIDQLAAYISVMAIQASNPVLIRIEGPESDDEACDEWMGERLLLPETAEEVDETTADRFFETVATLVDWEAEQGLSIDDYKMVADRAYDLWYA